MIKMLAVCIHDSDHQNKTKNVFHRTVLLKMNQNHLGIVGQINLFYTGISVGGVDRGHLMTFLYCPAGTSDKNEDGRILRFHFCDLNWGNIYFYFTRINLGLSTFLYHRSMSPLEKGRSINASSNNDNHNQNS